MKMLAHQEGLAVIATVETADLPKDTIVEITGDETVDKAAAGAAPIGRLVVAPADANGQGTVETRFKELVEMEGDGILAAGALVKLGTISPTTALHTAAAWSEGVDGHALLFGVVWKGGADEATIKVLTY
ncbi:MAG TPA: hypothetical protein VMM38_01340 [Aridibacter sp.]|nr:hypothetical protein [Aridibacter sp.]